MSHLADQDTLLLYEGQSGHLVAGHTGIPGHQGKGWQTLFSVRGPQVDLAFISGVTLKIPSLR